MKRDFSPEALIALPILSSGTAVVLCTQLLAAASAKKSALAEEEKSLPQGIADALEDLDQAAQALSAVRVPEATDPTAKKEADTALDTAWKNLHGSLSAWNNTPAPANPDPEGTQKLMSFLFSDGLKFVRMKYLEEWEASQSRLQGLDADPAYGQTIASLSLLPLLQAVQTAHASYGVALGITQPAEVSDTTAVREALSDLTFRLRVYVLQVVAYAWTRADDGQALAETLLEPLAVWVSPTSSTSTASATTASETTSETESSSPG